MSLTLDDHPEDEVTLDLRRIKAGTWSSRLPDVADLDHAVHRRLLDAIKEIDR